MDIWSSVTLRLHFPSPIGIISQSRLLYHYDMAPGVLTASAPVPSHHLNGLPASASSSSSPELDRRLFPDGLKTSGQHPPDPSALFPYAAFPKEINGRTLWKGSDFEGRKERWTRPFSREEIDELGNAADGYIASGKPMTAMSQVSVAGLRWRRYIVSW
jgi:hypothetical protein